jgi:hypothetical protein
MKKFSEMKGALKEAEAKLPDPPMVVILKRRAIRIFPNGQKVALYHNDLLNLDVSVPYFPGKYGNQEVSHSSLHETDTRSLENIVKKNKQGNVVLNNGASIQVQPSVAAAVLKLLKHKDLKPTNRKKLATYIVDNPNNFKDVVELTKKIS